MQYGLIGGRLGHSYSREIHAFLGDYSYELRELAPDEVRDFLQARDFCGINVTIPYKQTVMPCLDWISAEANSIGAVNTIVKRNGKLYGYNTDFDGMRRMLRFAGIALSGKKVLILGTGGTSKTAAAVAKADGAAEVIRVSRSGREGAVLYEDAARLHRDADVIINTTPVGMYPNDEGVPVDISLFPNLSGVADAVYHPQRTNLVLNARRAGIPACGGLYMLAAQAESASAIFTDRTPNTENAEKAYGCISALKRNIVLIGMPSCGKTTVGSLLADKLHRKLLDTDSMIVKRIGMPIRRFFEEYGEKAFRRLESEAVSEVSKEDGCVIATGGGCILDPKNVQALKRNGVLLFLDRSPDNLVSTPDRPLSADRGTLCRLYEERYPLYRAAADVCIDADRQADSVAETAADRYAEFCGRA